MALNRARQQTRKQRDPDDPTQILRTKKHGDVRVAGKFWMGGTGVPKIIILTPEGGYRYARGGSIKSEQALRDVIPEGVELDKALHWWANKDNWQKTATRKITFEDGTGYPVYMDTGEYVEDEDALQNYWPADGPTKHILWGAVAALNARREAKVGQKVDPQPPVAAVVAPSPSPSPDPEPPVPGWKKALEARQAKKAERDAKDAMHREMAEMAEAGVAGVAKLVGDEAASME
ncbi:MAG: hypothetical protein WC356_02315 [Candidatus Micrarchaeia archaeon]|jgi:hypothetical protein